jgi:putative ABC transport system permease protein
MVYVSFRQRPIGFAVAVVKGRSPERAGLVADVRRAVHAIDPDQPLGRLRSMDDVVSESVATRRLLLTIAGAFAALGLVLAITGVYGVVSHLTRRRSHEFGIRLALGADAPSLVRLVVAGTLWIVLAGLGLGAGGAWLVTGLIAAELYGVAPTDPATFATVGAGLGVVALLAAYLPARRAGRVDPIRTLRDS